MSENRFLFCPHQSPPCGGDSFSQEKPWGAPAPQQQSVKLKFDCEFQPHHITDLTKKQSKGIYFHVSIDDNGAY